MSFFFPIIKTLVLLVFIVWVLAVLPTPTWAATSWSEAQPAGDNNANWASVSVSSDGQVLLVGTYQRLYLSTNGGSSWSETQPAGDVDATWQSVRVSSSGQYLIAGSYNGRLYLSDDSGQNWQETQPTGNINNSWSVVTTSSDGQTLLAGTITSVYLSTNGGSNWTEIMLDADNWISADISPDGEIIVVAAYGSLTGIHLSTNGGDNWVETRAANDWTAVSMSDDGQTLLATDYSGRVYLSIDGGDNWEETQPVGNVNRDWQAAAVSGDGQVMLVGIYGGRLYLSSDGGDSWTETQPAGASDKQWSTLSINQNGETMVAGNSERIYLGAYTNPPPPPSPSGASSYSPPSPQRWQPPSCTNSIPGSPNLFQVDTNNSQATLYFVPASGADGYYVGYGLGLSTNQFGVQYKNGDKSGALQYTINLLAPNSTYSFAVRGNNGCMPGNWSNSLKIKTTWTSSETRSYFPFLQAR